MAARAHRDPTRQRRELERVRGRARLPRRAGRRLPVVQPRRDGESAQSRAGRGGVLMGYLDGFLVTIRQHVLFGGKRVTTEYSGGRGARKKGRATDPDVDHDTKIAKPERLHGRHVLNRYEDGMEKCIGCEL